MECKTHKRPKRKTKDGRELCPICENPFLNEVWETIFKNNRCVLIVVEGPPGTGKSYLCNKIAEDMDSRFFENPNITEELLGTRILFRPSMFARVLNETRLYKGAVIIMEEGGVQADHRKWYSFNNMVFNYILQTFRFMNLIVIVNVPVIQFIDSDVQKMFQFHIETIKVKHKERLNVVKIKRQTYNSGTKKIYRKFLRYKINMRWVKVDPWKFPRASAKLCREYEKLHKSFKRGLIDELAREMSLIDKQEAVKKKKALVNEDEAVAQVIADVTGRYYSFRAGKKVIDQSMIENDFGVGRSIGARIKKRAEWEIQHGGDA